MPTLSFARILNLLEAACLDQMGLAEMRKLQKAWLKGEALPAPSAEDEDPAPAGVGPRPRPAASSEYIDEDGSMGQPLPGLRERPVGYGL